MEQGFGRDLTKGSIPRHLVAFCLPMLAGNVLQTAYSFVNAIWVGKFLGTSALAAVTVSFPVVFALFAVGTGLTMATSILISQSYGAKNFEAVRRVVDSSTMLVGSLSIAIAVSGEIFAPSILRAMDTPAEILPVSVGYLRVFLLSVPLGFGLFLLRGMLQGVGDSRTPLYFQFGSLLFNAALDPVLMFGWLGLPRLGLNGTAWATCVSQLGALLSVVAYLHAKKTPVAPRFPRSRHLGPTTRAILRIGVPAAVQQSLVSIGMILVTGLVNGFGEVATAAFGVATRIDQIAFLPAITFGTAVSTVAGQNLGAGHHHRVRAIFAWGCLFSGGITLLLSIGVVTSPEALLRLFLSDPSVIAPGISYLHIVGACYALFALMLVSNGVVNGAGQTLMTTLFTLLSLWIVRVPLAYWLSRRMGSVEGIWYGTALSFGFSLTISMGYYFSGHWKRALPQKPKTSSP